MKPMTLGVIQLILAVLALVFIFMPIAGMEELPTIMLVLAFIVTAAHHLMEKK